MVDPSAGSRTVLYLRPLCTVFFSATSFRISLIVSLGRMALVRWRRHATRTSDLL